MSTRLLALLLVFTPMLRAHADDKADATKVVNSFYASYIAAALKAENGDKVVKKSPQLSPEFKKAYAAIVAKAWKEEPEVGLDYDPIVCGQDFPDAGFEVKSITLKDTAGSAVVSSKDPNFKHKIHLELVKQDGKWFIHDIEDFVKQQGRQSRAP